MCEELKNEHGFKFLCTRRLHQDPVENFFVVIRMRGGLWDNPTSLQFQQSFKQACLSSMLKPSISSNSDIDTDDFILSTLCDGQVSAANKLVTFQPGLRPIATTLIKETTAVSEPDQPEENDLF